MDQTEVAHCRRDGKRIIRPARRCCSAEMSYTAKFFAYHWLGEVRFLLRSAKNGYEDASVNGIDTAVAEFGRELVRVSHGQEACRWDSGALSD
jgi:hypothetical protein